MCVRAAGVMSEHCPHLYVGYCKDCVRRLLRKYKGACRRVACELDRYSAGHEVYPERLLNSIPAVIERMRKPEEA